MHHMNSEEINTFWEFERRWYNEKSHGNTGRPLLIKDIYHHFVDSKLQPRRDDWDNQSDDRFYVDLNDTTREWEDWRKQRMKNQGKYNELEKKAHLSFDDCAAACKSLGIDECFQYKFQAGICSISKAFRLGKPVKPESGDNKKRSISGWDVDKIRQWVEKQGDCKRVLWPDIKS